MKSLPIALLLLTTLPSLARLGETKAQCEARYGKQLGTTVTNKNAYYLKGGLQIIIGYQSDKAVFLFFTKLKPGTKETDLPLEIEDGDPLSEAERNSLLQANSGAFKWQQQEENEDADIAWDLSDGKGFAQFILGSLEVRDQPGLDAWNKEKALREAAPFKDFPRLGESKAEFEKRCGKPLATAPDGSPIYQKAGLTIIPTFRKEKAAKLDIFQQSAPAPAGGTDPFATTDGSDPFATKDGTNPLPDIPQALNRDQLSNPVLDAIIDANSAGAKWDREYDGNIHWTRTDDKAVATYTIDKALLTITDQEFITLQAEERNKEETKKLDGF